MDHSLCIKTMINYIENRVTDNLEAEEVAQAAGFSLPHFRAVFKSVTGQPLSAYITRRRLNHAAYEIAVTGRRLTDIAVTYAYDSYDAFTRAFRREFGENPSEFRKLKRTMGGTLIIPGVFGPMVPQKEGNPMLSNAESRNEHQCILYGVAKVGYFEGYEGTPFISSLRACLAFLGQESYYPGLLAASGAAFRMIWNLEYWDGGNIDIRYLSQDPTEPIRRSFAAAGRSFRILCKPGKEGQFTAEKAPAGNDYVTVGGKEDFTRFIKQEIDQGRPVIGFGIIGPPEACIITGYKEDCESLVGWNFFQDMPEFAGGVEKEPCGYFVKKGWFEHPETVMVVSIGNLTSPPDERIQLREVLNYALTVMETPKVGTCANGFTGYQAWADSLLKESEFPKNALLPLLMERLMCQTDAMCMIGEGRWCAGTYLDCAAGRYPEAADSLKAAAGLFKQEHGLVMEMGRSLEGLGMDEKRARILALPEIRQQLAVWILKAREMDMQAAGYIREAIDKL